MSQGVATIDSVAWRSTWRQHSVLEKVVLYGGVVALALSLPAWPGVPLLLAICLATTKLADVPLRHLMTCARVPLTFILIAAASTAVSLDLATWRLSVPADAIAASVELASRAMTASVATLLFASTTPMTSITNSMRRIGVPGACVDVVTVMYRLVFVLLESLQVIRQAQTSRLGYTTARRSANSAGLLAAAVLARSWTQASRLETGLAGRDFGVAMPMLDDTTVRWRFVAASIALLAAVATLSIGLGGLR